MSNEAFPTERPARAAGEPRSEARECPQLVAPLAGLPYLNGLAVPVLLPHDEEVELDLRRADGARRARAFLEILAIGGQFGVQRGVDRRSAPIKEARDATIVVWTPDQNLLGRGRQNRDLVMYRPYRRRSESASSVAVEKLH